MKFHACIETAIDMGGRIRLIRDGVVQASHIQAVQGEDARIARTRRWLDQMTREIDGWLAERRRKDTLQQYHTQLGVLGAVLTGSLARVRASLDGVPRGMGALYRACRAIDGDLVFIHRLWRYFADKLEQRDGPLGQVLRAADEVVWSLYAPVVRAAGQADARVAFQGPPLPHVEPMFSPRMIPRASPPEDLRARDRLFADIVNELPIPVVSVPPWCMGQPWWLVYLAHEVGHHIEHDLLPDGGLIGVQNARLGEVVGAALGTAAGPAGGPAGGMTAGMHDPQTLRWVQWNEEIFADVYAALTAGPAAVWALAEIVWAEEIDLLTDTRIYPSPALRLAMGQAVCEHTGAAPLAVHGRTVPEWLDSWTQGTPELVHRGVDLRKRLATDRATAAIVARSVCETPIGDSTLAALCTPLDGSPFGAGGEVARLAAAMAESMGFAGPLPVEAGANTARFLTSAAVLAYRELGALEDQGQRAEAEARLRETYLESVRVSREPGTRGPGADHGDDVAANALADVLADRLIDGLRAAPEEI